MDGDGAGAFPMVMERTLSAGLDEPVNRTLSLGEVQGDPKNEDEPANRTLSLGEAQGDPKNEDEEEDEPMDRTVSKESLSPEF